MAFIGYDYGIGSSALADRLRKEVGVFVVAGDWFGMDGFIRLGIGVERHVLEAGLERIDTVLRALR
jgi:aspartate/methionine/tyrosine aminotransferase